MRKIDALFYLPVIVLASFTVSAETTAISDLSNEKIEAMNELYKVSKMEEQTLLSMQQIPKMLAQTFAQQAAEKPPP